MVRVHPSPPAFAPLELWPANQTTMPFLVLGLILLVIGIIFLRKSIKEQDKEGAVGVMALIVASVIMILFFGLFYTLTIF